MKKWSLGLIVLAVTACTTRLPDAEFYVGTYADSTQSSGIYRVTVTENRVHSVLYGQGNYRPSYLAYDAPSNTIYGVAENGQNSGFYVWKNGFAGLAASPVYYPIQGADPCHISLVNGVAVVANYSSGSTLVGPDTANPQYVQHHGSSVHADRQTQSHVHMTLASKDNRYILATDLGADKIYTYDWDANTQRIRGVLRTTTTPAGSGPRFMVWHPTLAQLYVITEMAGTILRYEFKDGLLTPIDEVSLHPQNWTGEIGAAHIAFSQDGKFLYASDRGTANTITVYRVEENGKLNSIQHFELEGKGPRHFVLNAKEDMLVVGEQFSNEIEFIGRNTQTGKLTKTLHKEKMPAPSCILVKAL